MIHPEQFHEKLLVVDFVAYGHQKTEFFFDVTYEQATKKIWDTICPTAIILFTVCMALYIR